MSFLTCVIYFLLWNIRYIYIYIYDEGQWDPNNVLDPIDFQYMVKNILLNMYNIIVCVYTEENKSYMFEIT